MKMTRQRRRTARKLVLPLIAVAVMTTMMAMTSGASAQQTSPNVSHELYQR
jgi:hypothetical protein